MGRLLVMAGWLLCLRPTAAGQEGFPLTPGMTLEVALGSDESRIETAGLRAAGATASGRTFHLSVTEPGLYRLTLQSDRFDPYLVLRDRHAEVVAEDDNGGIGTSARVEFRVEPETVESTPLIRQLVACALDGGSGAAELSFLSSTAAPLGRSARLVAEQEFWSRRVAVAAETHGAKSLERAAQLFDYAQKLHDTAFWVEAEREARRALALRRELVGSEYPLVADSLCLLGSTLVALGNQAGARSAFEEALRIQDAQLGEGDLQTARTLHGLVAAVRSLGDREEAIGLARRGLLLQEGILGDESVAVAEMLQELGMSLQSAETLEEGHDCLERSRRILESRRPDSPELATTLDALSHNVRMAGGHEEALDLARRALQIRRAKLDPGHIEVAFALRTVGDAYYSLQRHQEAIENYREALILVETSFGLESSHFAWLQTILGDCLHELGRLVEARSCFSQALETQRKISGSTPKLVGALNGLARVEQARGRYDRALPLFEEALDIYTAHRPADHPDIALVFNNIGVLYFHMGRVEEALDYLREALAIRESHYGLGNLDVALTSSNVGAVLIKLGEYSEALELTEQAISVMERILGDQAHGLGSAYNNLGFAQKELGDSEGAKQSLLRSLEIFEKEWGPDHPQIGPILHNLGTLYLHTSQGEEAIKYFERALELRRKISGTDRHPRSGLTRSNLGLLYTWRGDLERANQMLSEALEVQEEALGTDHPDIAHTLNNLGINLRMQGRPAEARPCMERSVAMWEGLLGPTHLYVGQGRLELSRALLDVGDLQSAWTQMVQSAAVVSANLEPNLAALSEGEAFLYLADMRERLELQLGLAARMDQIDLQVAAYENLLEWKGKIHRLMVAGMRSLRKADAAAPGGALQRLQSIQSETSSLIFGSTEDDPEQRRRRLRELREEREGLEDELHRLDPDRIDSKEVTVAKLLKALAPREAYLDFLVYQSYQPARFHEGTMTQVGDTGPAHLWVWITRADQDLVTLDLGPAGRVQEATQRFLQMLVSRRGAKPAVAEHEDGSEELRTLLWDPLRLHLEDIDRILVSPDDFLCTLPFETLQTAQGRFLLEERSFVYVSDVAAVVADHRVSPRKAALKSLLSVGAVDFRKREGSKGPGLSDVVGAQRGSFSMYWGSLPATRYESQVVLDMHEDAFGEEGRRVLLQEERATEERLKREMPRHRMLHLATHGFFQPEGLPSMWNQALSASRAPGPSVGQPEEARLVGLHPGLLSGLVCAGSNAELEAGRDDGYLTAEEVAWLDLSEVEVVVLSACDTGLGLSRTGEGLVGLRRAFHIAGAQTVISSLWSVQDDSTGELMQKFYRNLILRGMGRHESLRTAQLEILRRNRALNGDGRPSSWGAFVLSGQW